MSPNLKCQERCITQEVQIFTSLFQRLCFCLTLIWTCFKDLQKPFSVPSTELTLLAGVGEVLSSGPSALLGIFRPPYFFQYIQQETHRRHCMFGGPHEYHWADCMAVNVWNPLTLVREMAEKTGLKTLRILISIFPCVILSIFILHKTSLYACYWL